MADLRENIARVLLTEEEIQSKVAEMAAQISEDYRDKQLLLVGILKGSMVFMADLMRRLSINAKIDFMSVSSYGSSTVSSGQVRIILDLKRPIYAATAAYGHFGRTDVDLPWEHLDKVDLLKETAKNL